MAESERTSDIIIIGGGIMGLCLAYYLTQQGSLKISLLEKDLLSQGSAWAVSASSYLTPQISSCHR